MNTIIPNSVTALVVATVAIDDTAAAKRVTRIESTKLLGVGLVTHAFDVEGNLRFWVRARAATLLTSEAALLDWVEDELALPTFITGYNLVASVYTLLDRVSPAQHPSIAALAEIDWQASELSIVPSPVQHEPLSVACEAVGIRVIKENIARDQRDWLTGRSAQIEERLLLQAAGAWKLWAARATQRGVGDERLDRADARLDAWLYTYLANRALPAFQL